ncbi:MAG: CocE/NonD family hydrolase [Bacillota bacterium]
MNTTVDVRMSDGIPLSTQVIAPDSGGPWPVLIARTPYGKTGLSEWLSAFTLGGYAVVVQDVRGTGESKGSFSFLRDELADAADTGQWILEQPFCNGSIGLIGISYLGASSVGIAHAFPKNVKAAVWVAPALSAQSVFGSEGAVRLHHNLPWTALSHPRFGELDWSSLYRHLPLWDALQSCGIDSPLWKGICSSVLGTSPLPDLGAVFREVSVPGLHFAGLWDFMLDASFFAWDASNRPGSAPQAMFLGPWSHNGIAAEVTKNAYADYGSEASSDFGRRTMQWFDHYLKGIDLPEDLATPVSAYVPGIGWLKLGAWPDPAARNLDLYLGDGTLCPEVPESDSREYIYDPSNPVPTEGGALWEFPKAGISPGPAVVTTGDRPDVLVFQSPVLDRRVTALGPVEVLLHATTDAPSTDFTAKLIDVSPEGTPRIVGDSLCRAAGPGPVEATIRMAAVGHVFERGHRIRLDVSSSNFPRFDRNLNTGVSGLISDRIRAARQSIRFGANAPSTLRLSVL